jgi:hypothetical protein
MLTQGFDVSDAYSGFQWIYSVVTSLAEGHVASSADMLALKNACDWIELLVD